MNSGSERRRPQSVINSHSARKFITLDYTPLLIFISPAFFSRPGVAVAVRRSFSPIIVRARTRVSLIGNIISAIGGRGAAYCVSRASYVRASRIMAARRETFTADEWGKWGTCLVYIASFDAATLSLPRSLPRAGSQAVFFVFSCVYSAIVAKYCPWAIAQ